MSASTIEGKDLHFFYDVTEGEATVKKCTAVSTSCKLSVSAASKGKSSKDSGNWEESKPGRLSWSGSVDALFTTDATTYGFDFLFGLMTARTIFPITFGVTTGVIPQVLKAGKTYTGNVWISKLDASAPGEDDGSFTCEFTGTGELEEVAVP